MLNIQDTKLATNFSTENPMLRPIIAIVH